MIRNRIIVGRGLLIRNGIVARRRFARNLMVENDSHDVTVR
jgi:hypothetical protein